MTRAAYLPDEAAQVVNWLHDEIGVSYASLAKLIGVDTKTVYRWRTQRCQPPARHRAQLYALVRIRSMEKPR